MTEGTLKHAEAREIVARIEERRVVVLPDALFGQLSSVVHGVGMLLLVEKIDAGLPARVAETCVILDGVQDAGNVGSILRSAAAAGIARVFCAPGTAYAWSSKVLRSGMGAHFLLDIFEDVELGDLIARLDAPVTIPQPGGMESLNVAATAAICLFEQCRQQRG
ncbi:rRNA methylases [Candidatus Paraburkholderia kirkii UZHbot1]|uniref:rRNA methylases n=1 Tax=Candidatus Paraburkholderia kirkii UZHbot1 TaxID=1055526 RepID=G4M9E9_9BURK|nr:rRNA methylases [Candidatus Paraburkholderia kirkii UZHbot1]